MVKARKRLLPLIIVALIVLKPTLAFAEVTYSDQCVAASTSEANTIVSSLYVKADTEDKPGYLLTNIKVSWEIKSGDSVVLKFWDGYATELQSITMDTSQLSAREISVTPPETAFSAQIVLSTSSTEGNRYAWFKEGTNNYGVTTVFQDPTIPPPSGGTDLTPVITEIQAVKDQLSSLSSDVSSQFNDVKGKLDTISSGINTMKDYFTIPRAAPPLQVAPLPSVSFNSTVPDMSEPYQEPYTYNRPDPVMPSPVGAPEPIPVTPDPVAMPHEEPRQAQEPRQVDQPVQRQDPRQAEPVNIQEALARELPRMLDPVIKETPRQRDPVVMDSPLTLDPPISRENPFTTDAPLTPEDPLTPTPPLTPEPPRTQGG